MLLELHSLFRQPLLYRLWGLDVRGKKNVAGEMRRRISCLVSPLCRLARLAESSFVRGVLCGVLSAVAAYLLLGPQLARETSHQKTDSGRFRPYSRQGARPAQLTRPRVLCLISTYPDNYESKALHVAATWAGRCDQAVFLSAVGAGGGGGLGGAAGAAGASADVRQLASFPLIEVAVGSGRDMLWPKTKEGIKRVWEDYQDQFDYLLKADDDTYVVVENLKKILHQFDPRDLLYMGHQQEDQAVTYMSGGSGYVLSAGAVERIVLTGLAEGPPAAPCHLPHATGQEVQVYPSEDLQLGACAKLLNIEFMSSEAAGGMTFLPQPLETHLIPDLAVSWFHQHSLECRQSPSSGGSYSSQQSSGGMSDSSQHSSGGSDSRQQRSGGSDTSQRSSSGSDSSQQSSNGSNSRQQSSSGSDSNQQNSGGSDSGTLCPLSANPVAFHYVRPYEMYVFDYLLYTARVG